MTKQPRPRNDQTGRPSIEQPDRPPTRFARVVVERLEDRYLLAANFDVLVFSKTAAFRHDSIPAGIQAIKDLGAANNFSVVATEDAAAFNDTNLAQFEAVVFLCTTGDVLNDTQQAAFERYIAAGHGYVGIHSAADTEYGWSWYGGLVGAYFKSHPTIQQATIDVADKSFPATAGLPERWTRTDEWYDFQTNPRGNVHVLATLDESTYSGGTMGFDHPISWAQNYGGGRSFYTGLGHTIASYSEPLFRQHILGGIEWAAGAVPGDAGATVNANFQKVVLDAHPSDPMELQVANDGRVYYVERGGKLKVWSPVTNATTVLGTIPVVTTNEDGLLGLALDPNFDTNHWVYTFYSATTANEQHVSRFTITNNQLDLSSEKVLLKVPVQRSNSNHSAGALNFGPNGMLYIGLGDNTSPFASDGFDPIDERPGRSDWDAQKSASNTNDLRGKILRIVPQANGTYTIPAGNLFPNGVGGKPEIYTMGNRNPFRFTVDPETGWLYWGEVGPDANNDDPNRGPRGYDEFNQARGPGNFGWPYFVGDNYAYNEYDFATGVSGPKFNPADPVNNSPNNTGALHLPPAKPAWIWYPYATSTQFPELGTGGRTAMAGPVYHYNPSATAPGSDRRLPAYYDDTLFIYEWSRNWIKEVKIDQNGNVLKINPFASNLSFNRPMDMKIGPDGRIYMLEWGTGFGGGNTDAQVVRIDYVPGAKPPVAAASADKDSGAAPLSVQFSSAGTTPGDHGPVTYAWDFDNNGTTDSTLANPSFTYPTPGNYTAKLTVKDTTGVTAVATVPISAGNSRPSVSLTMPADGSFFSWAHYLPYWAAVTDPEDGTTANGGISGTNVVIQPLLGHDSHAHPLLQYPGLSGVFPTEAGHGDGSGNLFMLVQATYTDRGAPGVQPLTGTTLVTLQPRHKQAEYFSSASSVLLTDSGDLDGTLAVTNVEDGDYLSYKPVNLQNIDTVRYRVSNTASGATVEVHADSPTGPLLSSMAVGVTGVNYGTQSRPITDPGGTHELFVVFHGTAAALANLKLNWIEFDRANNTAPSPSADAYRVAGARLDVPKSQGVLSNDADAQNDVLFAGLVAGPSHGKVVFNPDGSFTYTPDAGFYGNDTFTYFADDGVFTSAPATVTVQVPGGVTPGAGAAFSLTGAVGAPVLSVTGGTVTVGDDLGSHFPGLSVAAGGTAGVVFNATQHLAGLTLTGGATATLSSVGGGRTAANHRVLVTNALSIDAASGSKLDLADNDLILKGGGAAGLAAVQSLIGSGYAKRAWSGSGIVTSAAAGKTSNALGYLLNDGSVVKAKTTFGPNDESVGSTDVLVKYTYEGDANVDGQLSFDDYFYIDSKYPKPTGSTWVTADFNYDAQTSFDDYFFIDSNYPRNTPL